MDQEEIQMFPRNGLLHLLLLFHIFSPVLTFGRLGHYVIGEVMHSKLSETAKIHIQSCKYLEPFHGSMGNASNWADVIKKNPNYRWTSPLHYYDVDNDPPNYCGHVVPPRDKSRNLMSGMFRAFRNLSCSSPRPTCCGTQFQFNMMLHLVQDMHQPLHLTGKDRGGNERTFVKNGKRYNLHGFWDTDAIDLLMGDVYPDIYPRYTAQDAVDYFSKKSNETAKVDCSRVEKFVYKQANVISEENCRLVFRTDDDDYMDAAKKTVEELILNAIETQRCMYDLLFADYGP